MANVTVHIAQPGANHPPPAYIPSVQQQEEEIVYDFDMTVSIHNMPHIQPHRQVVRHLFTRSARIRDVYHKIASTMCIISTSLLRQHQLITPSQSVVFRPVQGYFIGDYQVNVDIKWAVSGARISKTNADDNWFRFAGGKSQSGCMCTIVWPLAGIHHTPTSSSCCMIL
jgi:hypothetical protein